jgi:hypothetical protein
MRYREGISPLKFLKTIPMPTINLAAKGHTMRDIIPRKALVHIVDTAF